MSAAITDDADNFLARMINSCSINDNQDRIDKWRECITVAHKSSREEHYNAIAFAYAIYCKAQISPDARHAITLEIMKRGIKLSNRKCPLRLALEICVNYHSGDDREGIRTSQKLYSRDTIAIRNLIDRGITPSEMVKLARRPNEGLDTWIRAPAKERGPVEEKSEVETAPTYRVIVEKRTNLEAVRLIDKTVDEATAEGVVESLAAAMDGS